MPTSSDSIEALLLKYKLRRAGQISRMEDHRLPKVVLYGELSTGHRDRGAPKKRFKDCLKKSLNVCHIDCQQWSDMAPDRDAWRHAVHKAASQFEVSHDTGKKSCLHDDWVISYLVRGCLHEKTRTGASFIPR